MSQRCLCVFFVGFLLWAGCGDDDEVVDAASPSDVSDSGGDTTSDAIGDVPSPTDTADATDDTGQTDQLEGVSEDLPNELSEDVPDDTAETSEDPPIEVAEVGEDLGHDLPLDQPGDVGDLEPLTCETAEFVSPDDIVPEDGAIVWVEGFVATGMVACTMMLCDEADPCCNSCFATLGFRPSDTFYPLDWMMHPMWRCSGTNCVEIESCIGPGPGDWLRVRAAPPRRPAFNRYYHKLRKNGVDSWRWKTWRAAN